MPAPPPAGVSSTARCRPSAVLADVVRRKRPDARASASPASDSPSGPGNMSGNSVRTLADQLMRANRDRLRRLRCRSRLPPILALFAFDEDGRLGDDAPACDVDHRHGGPGEGQHHGRPPFGGRDLEDVAGAEIEHGADRAEHLAGGVLDAQADQVGMIEFVLVLGRRQRSRGTCGALRW